MSLSLSMGRISLSRCHRRHIVTVVRRCDQNLVDFKYMCYTVFQCQITLILSQLIGCWYCFTPKVFHRNIWWKQRHSQKFNSGYIISQEGIVAMDGFFHFILDAVDFVSIPITFSFSIWFVSRWFELIIFINCSITRPASLDRTQNIEYKHWNKCYDFAFHLSFPVDSFFKWSFPLNPHTNVSN